MRVGLFTDTYYPEKNGVAVSTYQLRKGLEALGHEVYVFTVENKDAERDKEEEKNVIRFKAVNAVIIEGQKVALPLLHHQMKIVQSLNLDVIHTQTEFTLGILGWRAAKKFGIPHIHTYHTVYEEYTQYIHLPGGNSSQMKNLIRRLSGWWCNQFDLVIAPTKKTQDLLEHYRVQTKMDVVPTGLQLDKFAAPDAAHVESLREEYGLLPTDRVLIYLGRVSGEKNIDQLISYMENIADQQKKTRDNPSIKLMIVGGGPAEAALRRKADKLVEEGYVIFTGMVSWDQVQDYYALGDIFVSASTSETQGLTYYEAMASGLPVLAHQDECLNNILTDGVQGYQFVEAESFKEGLISILADLEAFSKQAKEAAGAFTDKEFAQKVEECYENAIEKNGFSMAQ
jgi:1,2-diacylglycerol 3-alpha-glucosyltransferase